ncbi:hypothetical protein C8R44DRAFT_892263 [Mycena epipterygia]|nr:hypothetical protein C8R44DRAFT_892263 [Mycena epipterygia]
MSCASPPSPSDNACVSAATTSTLIELLSSLFRALLAFHTRASSHVSQPPRPFVCSYCSDPAHLIRQCPHVLFDIRAGICQRNANSKVVLPSGLFVPHHIPGSNLRSRIAEYNRQLASAASSVPSSATPVVFATAPSPTPPVHSEELRTDSIQPQLAALPSSSPANESFSSVTPLVNDSFHPSTPRAKPDPDEIRLSQLKREIDAFESRRAAASITPASEPPLPSAAASFSPIAPPSLPVHSELRSDLSTPPTYRLPVTSADQIAGYAPPKTRNFGLPPPPPPRHKIAKPTPISALHSPALQPPFTPPLSDTDPEALVTITTRELLLLSPETRSQILAAAAVTSNIAYPPIPCIPFAVISSTSLLDKCHAEFTQHLINSYPMRIADRASSSN